jgi:putative ABC transport system permease protein
LPGSGSVLEDELRKIPGVIKTAGSDGMIGGQNWTNSLRVKGSEKDQLVNFLSVGYDFLDVLGVELKEGRNFSSQFPNDTIDGIILNEKAVRDLAVPSPVIGQQIVWAEDDDTTYYATVVGVAKDFHFTSLRSEIKPFAFVVTPQRFGSLAVKINSDHPEATLKEIEKVWNHHVSERMFDYYFLDDSMASFYRAEQNFRTVFSCFTILAIIIACLGLFGLVAFAAEQRTKEIGIRKVLGASITNIVSLLSKDFLMLVLIASVISFPIAWWALNKWLQGFAYRIDMQWWIFIMAAIAALIIASATVSFQAIKAAIVNPVKSLKAE